MKKITSCLLSFLLLIGLISSCSTTPEYGKLIPKDAFYVMTLDVEEAVESCELGDAEVLKEQLDESLAHARLPRDARKQLEDILENPQNSGFDFREPLYVFAASEFVNKFGVIGAVCDMEKLENFLDIMSDEDVCSPVLETDGLRYVTIGKTVLAFNDNWFFMTERVMQQDDVAEVLTEINRLAAQNEEQSLMSNTAFEEMNHREGFMHMLVLGSGLRDVIEENGLSYEELSASLPEGVDVSDFAMLCDLEISNKGEAKLVAETMPLTSEADDYLEEYVTCGSLEGDLEKYIPEDALFYAYGNIHGKDTYELMKKNAQFMDLLKRDPASLEAMEKVLTALEGDMAFVISPVMTGLKIPEMSFYAETADGEWLDLPAVQSIPGLKKIDDRTYSLGVPDPRYYNYVDDNQEPPLMASTLFGVKKGISYALFAKEGQKLEQVINSVSLNKDYNFYARMNAEQLLKFELIKKELGPIGYVPFKKIVKLFEYADFYVENGRKATLRIVMKNKEQSPVKTIYDEVEDFLGLLNA